MDHSDAIPEDVIENQEIDGSGQGTGYRCAGSWHDEPPGFLAAVPCYGVSRPGSSRTVMFFRLTAQVNLFIKPHVPSKWGCSSAGRAHDWQS